MSACLVSDCSQHVHSLDYCKLHYTRFKRHGDPLVVLRPIRRDLTKVERFWLRVVKTPECWLWTGQLDIGRYGVFTWEGRKPRKAHRIAYELLIGPIPFGLQLDHLCRNRACVNPEHLEPVTAQVNVLRSLPFRSHISTKPLKTHCPQGHAYNEANTRLYRGARVCRQCDRDRRHRETPILHRWRLS